MCVDIVVYDNRSFLYSVLLLNKYENSAGISLISKEYVHLTISISTLLRELEGEACLSGSAKVFENPDIV